VTPTVRPSTAQPAPGGRCARPWKALIKVGYACNNHCTFCHTLDLRDLDGTGPLVMRKIERARALGYAMVVLSGGEVTMRKELLLWAARTASLGMDFGLVTNGRMLAYPDLVAKLLRLRLRYVYLSLHGGEARVHNSLVRADAFDETVAAIGNLVGHGLDFTVNTVVTRQNLGRLRGVVDLLLPIGERGDLTLKFSMVQPKGGASASPTWPRPPSASATPSRTGWSASRRAAGPGRASPTTACRCACCRASRASTTTSRRTASRR
jgi:MoaA/NifB/PqqE/SkfB family radical SAM enzyme